MANNEFLITDIVGEKAFSDLTKLQGELKTTTTLYAAFAKEIASASASNPKTFDELAAKANGFTASLDKLNGAGEKMTGIQRRQLAVLKQVSAQLNSMSGLNKLTALMEQFTKNVQAASEALGRMSANASASTASQQQAAQGAQQAAQAMSQAAQSLGNAKVNYEAITKSISDYNTEVERLAGENAKMKLDMEKLSADMKDLNADYKNGNITLDEYQQKMGSTKMQYEQLNAASKQNAALIRNHATAVVSTTGSYYEMNAAMLELQKRFKALSEADRNSAIGQNLVKQANEINVKLKEIDAQFGNYQRNVGNYSSAWNGLSMSIQQIGRELPSLAMGWNTFFLAISNNLPMLTDELARAKKEYKDLTAQGQKATPVWKQVVSSLFSWQTALTVGITLLSVYGKDIMEWVKRLFGAEKAIKDLVDIQGELNKVQLEGTKNAQQEITRLKLLYNATQDHNRGLDERKKAVDELQKQYPSYFGNMTDEEVKAGKAADSYTRLTQSIVAAARARAAENKILENQQTVLENEEKINEAFTRLNELEPKLKKAEAQFDAALFAARQSIGRLSTSGAQTLSVYGNNAVQSAKSVKDELKRQVEEIRDEISVYRTSIYQANKLSSELERGIDIGSLLSGGSGTDDAKKAADDYAAYIKKVTEDLNKSRIDLMREGRDKEVAEIKADYDARIAEITGNTKKEIELRENLETLKQRAIEEVDAKYAKGMLDIEKENIENRIAAIAGGNQREIDERMSLQLQLNEMMRDAEVAEAKKSGADVASVVAKYEKEKNDIVMQSLEERFGLMERGTDEEIRAQELAAMKEGNALKKQYADGTITREEYERGMNEITLKYSKMRLQTLIDEARAQLELAGLTDEQMKDLETRIDELQAKLEGLDLQAGTKDVNTQAREFAEAMRLMERSMSDSLGESGDMLMGMINLFGELTTEGEKSAVAIGEAVMQIANGLASVMNDIYQSRIDALDDEQEANEDAYDKEVERIEALQEQGAISTEEAEARKRAAEDKTRKNEEEIARKKAQLEQKQARWDKANSIIQATIATALAVTKALPNLVLAAVVGAMGAAQIAMISAQSVPKYAKGTKDHQGGLAVVGDGGRPEGIVTKDGVYVSPSTPTLVDLPKHAKVIPDLSAITSTSGLRSDFGLLEKQLKGGDGKAVQVNVDGGDFKPLERRMDENTKELKDIRKLMRKQGVRRDFARMAGRL